MMNGEKQTITYKSNIKCSNINDLKLIHSNKINPLLNCNFDDDIEKKINENITYDDVLKIMTCKHDIGYSQDPP